MNVKKLVKNHFQFILIAIAMIAVVFLWSIHKSFSSDTDQSGWNGTTIAESFAGGNGSHENPYVISNGEELAYFKSVLESDNTTYGNLSYELSSDINMGEHEFTAISENFSGELNGRGHKINNIIFAVNNINNYDYYGLFSTITDATIYNLSMENTKIETIPSERHVFTGLIAAKVLPEELATIKNISISNASFDFKNTTENENNLLGTVVGIYNEKTDFSKIYVESTIDSTYSSTIGGVASNIATAPGLVISKTTSLNNQVNIIPYSNINDIAMNPNQYIVRSDNKIYLNEEEVSSNNNYETIMLLLNNDLEENYSWSYNEGTFGYNYNEPTPVMLPELTKSPILRAAPPTTAFTPSPTSVNHSTQVMILNTLDEDYDYFKGLDYTEIRNATLPPDGGYGHYDDQYLVAVQITYDGTDYNRTNLVGEISPINNENINKIIYYKYFALERNADGTLATFNNSNYIKIPLIDNPFTKRPVENGTEFGFNGWVCNQNSETSTDLCENSTFEYRIDKYTRYLIVPTSGGTELKIYLNASWHRANVITDLADISTFNDISMQQAYYDEPIIEVTPASPYWNQAYEYMEFEYTVGRYGAIPRNYWYQRGTDTTYRLANSNNTTCGNYNRCYVYSRHQFSNNNLLYDGNSYDIIYRYTNQNTRAYTEEVSNYNTDYMHLEPDPNGTYQMTAITGYVRKFDVPDGGDARGYFYKVSNPTTAMLNTKEYYTSSGTICTSTSSCSTAYKLIDGYETMTNSDNTPISQINYDANDSVIDYTNYYYLVTRDQNIFRHTGAAINISEIQNTTTSGTSARNRPFTVTGTAVNGTTQTGILTMNSNPFVVRNDLVLENIKLNGPDNEGSGNGTDFGSNTNNNSIDCNGNNVKIGRNIITSDNNANHIVSNTIYGQYTGSVSGAYTIIVESGFYNIFRHGYTNASSTFNATAILGSDYDKANNDNSKLKFRIGMTGFNDRSSSARYYAGNDSPFVTFTYLRSGMFGFTPENTANTSQNGAGIYVGGRGSSTHVYSPVGFKNEGAVINIVLGGSGFQSGYDDNYVYASMSSGSIRQIYTGATSSATQGNRIINVSGGTINYSVLGGSYSYANNYGGGAVRATTVVYVGGSAVIGTENDTLNGVESGSVFGAGGGFSGDLTVASAYHSRVIINGGTINKSVYGGGNYGSVGTQENQIATTKIKVLDGTINGGVYGGSKSNDFSVSNHTSDSTIDIDIYGGTIANVFGGSDTYGTCYGTATVNIHGGTIGNVYGGGEGGYQNDTNYNQGTYMAGNVIVNIGTQGTNESPTISSNVYGGSAYGTVNGTTHNASNSSYSTTVNMNSGTVQGSIFGGGKGGTVDGVSYTPNSAGTITTNINGGSVGNVFGGHDQAGSHTGSNHVYLNGGTIGNVYGGGNRSSVTTTNVHEQGSTVTSNIFGGSNQLGTVTTSNVSVTSGTCSNVFGGNNEGGSCTTTNVTINGTATINGNVYGGGNEVDATTANVTLTNNGNTIPNVFGGGNEASVTTVNINKTGCAVGSLFGGSNTSGSVNNCTINYNGGSATDVYGGNNAGGNTISSTINIMNGTATNVYAGGNQANSGSAYIVQTGGTVTTMFGGGNNAGLNGSTITINNGNVGTIYGGSNNSGTVSTTNVTVNNVSSPISDIFGGGNKAQVGTTSVTFNNGTVGNIYGGGNLAQCTGNTVVDINGGTVNTNIYGGGNMGVVAGSSTVTITDATILGSAYAGGNGSTAILQGSTSITVDGNTVIGTSSSVPPHTGSVFGGGNQAATGVQANNNSQSTVNIAGGTIYGNVYGGANTSVIYGSTDVNIGTTADPNNTLDRDDIHIYGHVFGGGEANAAGSETYDWFFISVTQGTEINVNAQNYTNFAIDGSFYGGGNASSASGDSYLNIYNYGVANTPKRNVSIQRVKYVTIDNSSILLHGAVDRANEYDTELFSISRVENLKLKNNSQLYLDTGANLLEQFESLDSSGNPAVVTINTETNTITNRSVDNRVYMLEGKNLNIAHDQQVTDYGEVIGMSFLGMFNYNGDQVNNGIYRNTYNPGDVLPWEGTFTRGSYVLGKHTNNHNIKINGFYSNFMSEDGNQTNIVDYINPTPEASQFYMWFIGENVIEYNVNLVASKYSTLGSLEVSFLEFYKPNTSFQILGFDSSEIEQGISLVDKNNIPRVAATAQDANNIFGLSMEASNTGWLTTGKTNFFTTNPNMSGVNYYEGENSTAVPTLLFYLYHSKNLSEEKDLGTGRISVMAITKLSALSNEIKRLVINVNMSTALFQTTEYEGSMTPGDKYELFTSTSINITTKSKLSAYYSIFGDSTNLYRAGYHHVLSSSLVLPAGTKMTMIDFASANPEYYYYVVDAADQAAAEAEFQLEGDCSYPLSKFKRMGTESTINMYNDATMNAIYYNGTHSEEEFIFIVDFSDSGFTSNQLGNTLLMELRDSNEETIITVLGIQHSQLTYNLYYGLDSQIQLTATPDLNPLYIGYNDEIDVLVNYTNSTLSGVTITDTQYFDSRLGVQISIKNSNGHVLSGTDLTGTYFYMDNKRYYPDIAGYTHIKLSDKVGNAEKWIIFNTENSSLATGTYTFVFETFASPDGIYFSSGNTNIHNMTLPIINSKYGLNPVIDDNSVVYSGNGNDKSLNVTIGYTSLLDNPNIRIAMYRRKYDLVYDTNYELVDLQDFVDQTIYGTTNTNEYLLVQTPYATNTVSLPFKDTLLTGTYQLSFRLYDGSTLIGEVIRYIIIK